MNLDALFKISHGLYVTGARDTQDRLIGSCIDAVMVIETSPAQIMISLEKNSFTCENVLISQKLSLSVLPVDTPDDVIRNFGMQSSKITDKWKNVPYHLYQNLPVLDQAPAYMTLVITQRIETATHWVLLCDVQAVEPGSMAPALIYADYQNRKRKENKMTESKKWVCTVCGYVYDGEVPFEELPDDWTCPLCGEPKSVFVQE